MAETENDGQGEAAETPMGSAVGKPVWSTPQIVEISIARDTRGNNNGSSDGFAFGTG